MNSLKQSILHKFNRLDGISGVIHCSNPFQPCSITNGFQHTILVITDNSVSGLSPLNYYIKEGHRLQERWISLEELKNRIMNGDDRLGSLLMNGELILDADSQVEQIMSRLREMPKEWKERILLAEFSRFFDLYLRSREMFMQDHYIDAYTWLVQALYRWARVVIMEQGVYPAASVWEQVKQFNVGVHKLYEELVLSKESMKLRVQLVLLACEFSVMSKMESCCQLLLDIIEGDSQTWTSENIANHPSIRNNTANIPMLLGALVKKSLLNEVAFVCQDNEEEVITKYTKTGYVQGL